MCRDDRLINDFRCQRNDTIFSYMNKTLLNNYDVCSRTVSGFDPYFPNNDITIFAHANNVVVVFLDCCGQEGQTYYESSVVAPVIFRQGEEPRESVVWKVREMVLMMQNRLLTNHVVAEVYGVLLTEATILNAEELDDMWFENNIMVFSGFSRLSKKTIEDNYWKYYDYKLPSKLLVDNVLDSSLDMEAWLGKRMEELTTHAPIPKLDDEIKNLFNFDENEEMPDFEDLEDTEDDEEQDDDLSEDTFAKAEEDDRATENIFYPDGDIKRLGGNISVEILRPMDNPREELDKLVGCQQIKQRIDELLSLTSYNQLMSQLFPNIKHHEVSLHSIFFGRPGTGKTTVCRIFGSLLHQAGVLSKGHVMVCDRSTFIGNYWGDEESSTHQVIEKAQGGVLMIDEAYLLNSSSEKDPGGRVLPLMMSLLADEKQRDIAVVLCGYKDPMQKLLDTNSGLNSRFPNRFEFNDFSVDELLEITRRRIGEYQYSFTEPAWQKYTAILHDAYQVRDPQTWGNARFVANQLERIYLQHAQRCMHDRPVENASLLQLTPADIQPIEVSRPRPRIGF